MFKKFKKSQEVKPAADSPDLMSQWMDKVETGDEGHLAVDVFQLGDKIIVKSTIAGARPQDLEVSINGDILTIKGERYLADDIDYDDYLYRECYWGKFSRTIILPVQVDETAVDASLDNGVLTVILPKLKKTRELKVKVKD
jgi:HSP20 family protein